MATWSDESVLQGPPSEDRGRPRARSYLRRPGPARTFGVGISTVKRYATKAQRGVSLWSRVRHPANLPRWTSGSGNPSKRTSRSALSSPPSGAPRLRGSHKRRGFGEPPHHVPRHSSERFHAQKGGRSATERDELLRAAWRVMGWPQRRSTPSGSGVLVDEMGARVSFAPPYGYSPKGELACA